MNVVDLFAGGGGASSGIHRALGVAPRLAINHCAAALEMHAANHPTTVHLREDLLGVRPFRPGGKPIDVLWGSPDCTHHSRAKGGKPRENRRRMLAWVILEWARAVTPRLIFLENVPEFEDWGPLDDEGRPDPARKGETFREFVQGLRLAGYWVSWRVLVAADFGAPTIRRRLYMVARCDGQPVRWPVPTHGPGRAQPWRTAAECIDWSIPVPSIFGRKRPLAEATQRRVAEGIRRYVLESPRPFIVATSHQSSDGGKVRGVDSPLSTVVTKAEHCLVAAFLAKHYGGVVGAPLEQPLGTVTAVDHHSLVVGELATVSREAGKARAVAAFLTKFYGTGGQWQRADEPMHTIPTLDRFGLVTVQVEGEPYVIVDIGLRMLQPRELARAQGFPDDYILTGSKREQVARIGNSVCPPVAEALVAAQFPDRRRAA